MEIVPVNKVLSSNGLVPPILEVLQPSRDNYDVLMIQPGGTPAERLHVSLSYISKVETERLNAGDYPSEAFVMKLPHALEADEDELLLMTDRVPAAIRKRIQERPDVFKKLVSLSDQQLDDFVGG